MALTVATRYLANSPSLGADGSVAALTVASIRWARGFDTLGKGLSHPVLLDLRLLRWRHRRRRREWRPGRGVAGGKSVFPDTAEPVGCGTFLGALTERLFRRLARSLVSSVGIPLLEREWSRSGRRSWPCCRARLQLSSAQEAHIA